MCSDSCWPRQSHFLQLLPSLVRLIAGQAGLSALRSADQACSHLRAFALAIALAIFPSYMFTALTFFIFLLESHPFNKAYN